MASSFPRVLVLMQILRAGFALSIAPSSGAQAGVFLERADPKSLEKQIGALNDQALIVFKKMDALELQCKAAQIKDKEVLAALDSELRAISGQLAGNVAQVGAAESSAAQDKANTVKLKGNLVDIKSMCHTQERALNASVELLLKDSGNAKGLRAISSKCGAAVLVAVHANTSVTSTHSASLLQGCTKEVAAGEALERGAGRLATSFAKQAFSDALQQAAWPSNNKPPSKAKAKSANSCKLIPGSVNCGKLKSQLDTLAMRLEEQKDHAVTNQRKSNTDCQNKVKSVNVRFMAATSQQSRSGSELVRLVGVKAGLAASRATVVTRLESAQRASKKFQATCTSGTSVYKGDLEDIKDKRKPLVNKLAGYKTTAQDCKVTTWLLSKCTKKCKVNANDAAGTMEATRDITSPAGIDGMSCPPLTAKLPCGDKPCPINCAIAEWAKWGACSKACGGGTTKRTRSVLQQPKDGGTKCPLTEERKPCNMGSCGDECKLKEWTPWSTCTRRCKFSKNSAGGRQRREREVIGNPLKEGGVSACPAKDDTSRLQTQGCNNRKKDICPKGTTCDASQDIVFLLDASGAAGAGFDYQKKLVAKIVKRSSAKVNFGVVSYGKDLKILSRITGDRSALASFSSYAPPTGGSRQTLKATTIARSLFSAPGVGGGRPKIAVLFLGGSVAGFSDSKKAAKALRAANVRVVVALMDDGSQLARDQACSLASYPCSANVEAVKSWEQMSLEPGRFLAGICRNLVYPGQKEAVVEESSKNGDLGSKSMPSWLKRKLGLD